MSYTIERVQQPAQHYVAVRATTSMSEMGTAMAPLFGQLFGWLGQKGIEPVGPPWARYLTATGDAAEYEVAAPVAALAESDGRVICGTMPACTVARTTHTGPYETLGEAYEALDQWMTGQGLRSSGAPWEVYLTDPQSEPDPARWETVVSVPCFA